MGQKSLRRDSPNLVLKEFALKYGLYIGFVAILLVFSVISPNFLTVKNLLNLLNSYAYYVIASIGMMFVILIGGVDLSNSGMVAAAGVIGAMVMAQTKNTALGIVVIMAICIVGGLINGIAITWLNMPPFVTTLAFQYFYRGIAFTLTMAGTVKGLPKKFTSFYYGETLGIRNGIVLLIIVFLVALYLLNFTVYGKRLYATGDNANAAKVMGINVNWVKTLAYVLCGTCTGLATILLVSFMGSARAAVVQNLQLECIAAVIIGGASATGGEGKIFGTLVGAFMFAMIKNGLNLLGFSYYYQIIATGIIIYIAAVIDRKRIKAGL